MTGTCGTRAPANSSTPSVGGQTHYAVIGAQLGSEARLALSGGADNAVRL